LRRTHAAWRVTKAIRWPAIELDGGSVGFRVGDGETQCLVLSDLRGGQAMPGLEATALAPIFGRAWRRLLSSNEARFGGDETIAAPATLIFEAI
jgi:hypothetical protein